MEYQRAKVFMTSSKRWFLKTNMPSVHPVYRLTSTFFTSVCPVF